MIMWATSWENLFMPYATNKGADQPVHPRSLNSTFVVHCLNSTIDISSFYIRSFKPLANFCGCAGRIVSYLLANPEDRFSRDEAHVLGQEQGIFITDTYNSAVSLSYPQYLGAVFLYQVCCITRKKLIHVFTLERITNAVPESATALFELAMLLKRQLLPSLNK